VHQLQASGEIDLSFDLSDAERKRLASLTPSAAVAFGANASAQAGLSSAAASDSRVAHAAAQLQLGADLLTEVLDALGELAQAAE
jgi:hypothetical protein